MKVRHGFVSQVPDDLQSAADGEVLPSHWNADHVFEVEPKSLVGNSGDVSAAAQAVSVGNGLSLLSGVLALAGAPVFIQPSQPAGQDQYLWLRSTGTGNAEAFVKQTGQPEVPLVTGAAGAGQAKVQMFTLTAQDIQNKYIALDSAPSAPDKTLVQLQMGIAQYPNVDFYLDGQLLRWNSLAMELLVESGQRIHVTYQ